MTINKNKILTALLLLGAFLLLLVSGCAAGDTAMFNEASPAGFFMGVWHGMIVWFTLIIGLFSDNVEIYERFNNGGWYDFGFLLGAGGSVGATARTSKR